MLRPLRSTRLSAAPRALLRAVRWRRRRARVVGVEGGDPGLPAVQRQFEWAYVRIEAGDPVWSLGPLALTPAPAEVQFTAGAPVWSVGGVTLAAAAAEVTFFVLEEDRLLDYTLGDVTLAAEVASVAFSAGDPVWSVSDLSLAAAPASVAFTAGDPTWSLGPLVVSPQPAEVAFSADDVDFVVSGHAGTMRFDLERAYEFKGPIVSMPVARGTDAKLGAAMGLYGPGFTRPLQAGDPFVGILDVPLLDYDGDRQGEIVARGTVELVVMGVTGPQDYGREVFALSDDAFTTDDTGSQVGRVAAHIGGRRCAVAFEGAAYRSLDN